MKRAKDSESSDAESELFAGKTSQPGTKKVKPSKPPKAKSADKAAKEKKTPSSSRSGSRRKKVEIADASVSPGESGTRDQRKSPGVDTRDRQTPQDVGTRDQQALIDTRDQSKPPAHTETEPSFRRPTSPGEVSCTKEQFFHAADSQFGDISETTGGRDEALDNLLNSMEKTADPEIEPTENMEVSELLAEMAEEEDGSKIKRWPCSESLATFVDPIFRKTLKQETWHKLQQDYPPPELDALYVPELDPQIKQTDHIMREVSKSRVDKELRAASRSLIDISGPICRLMETCLHSETGYVNARDTAKLAGQAIKLVGHAVSVINGKRRTELLGMPCMAPLRSALGNAKEGPTTGRMLFGPDLGQRVKERSEFSSSMKELYAAEKTFKAESSKPKFEPRRSSAGPSGQRQGSGGRFGPSHSRSPAYRPVPKPQGWNTHDNRRGDYRSKTDQRPQSYAKRQMPAQDSSVRGKLSLGCASLAKPILVQPATGAPSRDSSATPTNRRPSSESTGRRPSTTESQIAASDGVAIIRQSFAAAGLSSDVANVLLESWRVGTRKHIISSWTVWYGWCKKWGIDPLSPNVKQFLDFLHDQFKRGVAYATLNGYRSAVNQVLMQAGRDSSQLVGNSLVTRFFKGVFNLRPPAPRYQQTWNVTQVENFISSTWPRNDILSLPHLTKKLAMLLALERPSRRSEIANIALPVAEVGDQTQTICLRLLKPTKTQKQGPLHVLSITRSSQPQLCPVQCLTTYVKHTQELRKSRPQKQHLFLSYVRPNAPVTADTMSRWLVDTMSSAGIDTTKFKAHSTRSAVAAHLKAQKVHERDIMKLAGWKSENTFRRFYDKPILQSEVEGSSS